MVYICKSFDFIFMQDDYDGHQDDGDDDGDEDESRDEDDYHQGK